MVSSSLPFSVYPSIPLSLPPFLPPPFSLPPLLPPSLLPSLPLLDHTWLNTGTDIGGAGQQKSQCQGRDLTFLMSLLPGTAAMLPKAFLKAFLLFYTGVLYMYIAVLYRCTIYVYSNIIQVYYICI